MAFGKRENNYWEPVYQPEKNEPSTEFNWGIEHNKGPTTLVCTATKLLEKIGDQKSFHIPDIVFSSCDFSGDFRGPRITFKDCKFQLCDFGRTKWVGVKFSKCLFEKTSLSTSTFEACDFLDCTWIDVGLSSLEMHMSDCVISNPENFINSAYTNTDEATLSQLSKSVSYQKYRLEKTKMKIARNLMTNLQSVGEDEAFYESVMTYTNQVIKSKISQDSYTLCHDRSSRLLVLIALFRLPALYLEQGMVLLSGRFNGWGGKLGRCFLLGLAIVIFFGWYYWLIGALERNIPEGLLAALEITLLVGFTKFSTATSDFMVQLAFSMNMLLGIWWYAVFVPTLINRLSRVR